MRGLRSAIVASAMLALAGPAAGQGGDTLSGVWQGVYWAGGNETTEFQATIVDFQGPGLQGSMAEPNTFGDSSSRFLLSTFAGNAIGGVVSFTKTYDGTAGVGHSVNYSGRLISDRHIVGSWQIDGTVGSFEMAR